ncbi:MAG: FAD-dependent thymidylate synthase, partial [Hyphomicrobiaceae bacterium]
YEPTGQSREFSIYDTGALQVNLLPGHATEEEVMRRLFVGYCSTWGLEGINVLNPADDSLVRAVNILGLSGQFWTGQQFEGFNMSFAITNVSRGFTHQLVRSRFMSFGQEGTRDTNQRDHDNIVPDTIMDNPGLFQAWCDVQKKIREFYEQCMMLGIPFQDASYILPKSMATDIVVHTNYRELQGFMTNRLSNTMHWEINEVARRMRALVKSVYPVFGLWLMPACERAGVCQSQGTLFPPCGKLPLRPGQSDEINRMGVPYMHSHDMNPNETHGRSLSQRRDYETERMTRDSLVRQAKNIVESRNFKIGGE